MAPSLQKRLHQPASRVCQRVRTLKRSKLTSSDPPHLLDLPRASAMLCGSPGGAEISWLAVISVLARVSQLQGGFWEKVARSPNNSKAKEVLVAGDLFCSLPAFVLHLLHLQSSQQAVLDRRCTQGPLVPPRAPSFLRVGRGHQRTRSAPICFTPFCNNREAGEC